MALIQFCGCADYGYLAEYKILRDQTSAPDETVPMRPQIERRLRAAVSEQLRPKDYEEPGEFDMWSKPGTYIYLREDQSTNLLLLFRAYGSKKHLARTKQIEQELTAVLREHYRFSLERLQD